MMQVSDMGPLPFQLTGARIAMLGYGSDAAEQAVGLRRAGNAVAVGTRDGGLSRARASKDGFPTGSAYSIVEHASVIVVLLPEHEQAPVYWGELERNAAPSALLVVGRALALGTRA